MWHLNSAPECLLILWLSKLLLLAIIAGGSSSSERKLCLVFAAFSDWCEDCGDGNSCSVSMLAWLWVFKCLIKLGTLLNEFEHTSQLCGLRFKWTPFTCCCTASFLVKVLPHWSHGKRVSVCVDLMCLKRPAERAKTLSHLSHGNVLPCGRNRYELGKSNDVHKFCHICHKPTFLDAKKNPS